MKLSARNQLKGKVVDIKEGAVNGIVSLETKGGEIITSTISMGSIKELGLKTIYQVPKPQHTFLPQPACLRVVE